MLSQRTLNGAQRLKQLRSSHGTKVNFFARVNRGEAASRSREYQTMDAAILPRPPAMEVVSQLPSADFSMLQSALLRTGLAADMADTRGPSTTLFAPSDAAFRKLGKQVTDFLFDREGLEYLHALLKYHMVPSQKLWSSTFENLASTPAMSPAIHSHGHNLGRRCCSFALPTMLAGRELSVDISQFGGLVSMLVNRFTPVAVQDGVASSVLIHFVGGVLLPGTSDGEDSVVYGQEDLDVGELKLRLAPG